MLSDYITKAMTRAIYERLGDGTIYGEIPECQGVWANEQTLPECQRVLQEVLEGWLIFKLRDNDPDIPVIDGISLDVRKVRVPQLGSGVGRAIRATGARR